MVSTENMKVDLVSITSTAERSPTPTVAAVLLCTLTIAHFTGKGIRPGVQAWKAVGVRLEPMSV